jgi:transcriptional regulator with XRE-family HTH domain
VPPQSNRFALYLKARRAQLKPEDVGFPADPARRLRGLKRAEVAELAGISPEYYTRLEQGRSYRVSESVLAGLTRALRLDADAAEYFYRLALPESPVRTKPPSPVVVDHVLRIIEQWSDVPVYLYDRNLDVLTANDLALALFPKIAPGSNSVMSAFAMAPDLRETPQWAALASTVVAALRFHGDPADPRLQQIVGELSVREPLFRRLWADHTAVPLTSGVVPAYIEGFGPGEFPWQNLNVPGGLFMGIWPAPPGTFAGDVIEHLRRRLRGAEESAPARPEQSGGTARLESIRLVIEPVQSDDPAV